MEEAKIISELQSLIGRLVAIKTMDKDQMSDSASEASQESTGEILEQFSDHILEFFNKVDLHNNPEIENADKVIESMAQIVQRFKSEPTIEDSDEENDEEIDDAEVDDDTESETIDFGVETDEVIDMEIVDSDQAPDGKAEFELMDSEEETDDKTDIEPTDSSEESEENTDTEIVDSDEESDEKTEFELMDSDEESDSETNIIGGGEVTRKQVESLKTFQNVIRKAIRVGITLQEVRDIIRSVYDGRTEASTDIDVKEHSRKNATPREPSIGRPSTSNSSASRKRENEEEAISIKLKKSKRM